MIDSKRFSLYVGVFSLVFISWVLFMVTGSIYAWMIIPVFTGLAILIGNPQAMLWYGLSWFMVTQYAQTELRVGFFNYLDEFVTLGMLSILLVQSRGVSASLPGRENAARPMPKIALAFVLLAGFSAAINHAVDIYFVMWCFQYLRMFVVFFFVIRFAQLADARKFVRFLMFFSVLDFVLNITWKWGLNPLPNARGIWESDFGIGTFAGCDQVAYFCVLVIVLCLAVIVDPPTKKHGQNAMWVLLITFISFMITNTIHAFFLLVPAIGLFFIVNYRSVMKVVSWPALLGVMALGMFTYLVLVSYTDAGVALKPEYIMTRYEQFQNEPKMIAYRRSLNELPRESSYFYVAGHGPGQAASSIGRALRRPIANKYYNTIYNQEQFRNQAIAGSISSGEQTGILVYWSETGPLGLLLLVLAFLTVLIKTRRRLAAGEFADKYQLALARAFPSVVLVVALLAFLRDMFYIAWFSGVMWVWAALVITPLMQPSKKTEV